MLGEAFFALAAWPLGLIGLALSRWIFGWSFQRALFAGAGLWLISRVIGEAFEYGVHAVEQRKKPKRGGICWFSETIPGQITLLLLVFGIPASFFWLLSMF